MSHSGCIKDKPFVNEMRATCDCEGYDESWARADGISPFNERHKQRAKDVTWLRKRAAELRRDAELRDNYDILIHADAVEAAANDLECEKRP